MDFNFKSSLFLRLKRKKNLEKWERKEIKKGMDECVKKKPIHLPKSLLKVNFFFSFADIDECRLRGESVCGPLEVCVNSPGSYRCINQTEAACKKGEEKQGDSCIG